MATRVPIIPAPAERRIRREARSATLRERALALRQAGWIYANIGMALGVSVTRALQMVRKAERISKSEKGAPSRERPSDSTGPRPADRNTDEQGAWYPPTTT